MRMHSGKLKASSYGRLMLAALAFVLVAPAWALEAMDDSALADTTGQQGVTFSSNYSISIGLDTAGGATSCTTNCYGGFNVVDSDGFTLSSQAHTSVNSTGGTSFSLRGFTVTGAAKLLSDVAGNGLTGASATAVAQNQLQFLGASVGGSTNYAINVTFSSQFPSGTQITGANYTGLGIQVADVCANSVYTTGIGCNTANVANDYPVIMAPSTGVVMSLQTNSGSSGMNTLNLMAGAPSAATTGYQGHMFVLTSASAGGTDTPDTFTIAGSGNCSNQGTSSVSCTTTKVNFALVDPGSFNTAGSDIGGVGVGSLAVSNIDFGTGTSSGNYMSIDLCNGTATTDCPAIRTGGAAGILVTANGTALSGVNIVAKGLTIGNVGATGGVTGASNGLGAVAVQNLNMTGMSVLVSGH